MQKVILLIVFSLILFLLAGISAWAAPQYPMLIVKAVFILVSLAMIVMYWLTIIAWWRIAK